MAISINANAFQGMITDFSKSLTYTPRTEVLDNITGDNTFTNGTPATIAGSLFRQEDKWVVGKGYELQGADAILLILPSVSVTRNSLITYDSQDYRIESITTRRLGTVSFYQVVRLFKIG